MPRVVWDHVSDKKTKVILPPEEAHRGLPIEPWNGLDMASTGMDFVGAIKNRSWSHVDGSADLELQWRASQPYRVLRVSGANASDANRHAVDGEVASHGDHFSHHRPPLRADLAVLEFCYTQIAYMAVPPDSEAPSAVVSVV
eukprot:gene9365-2015_t